MSPAVPLPIVSDRRSCVVIIGIDPHKRTHTASALEPGTHRVLATLQIEATLAGYRQLLRWAVRCGWSPRWAVENAHGLGSHLAQWLTARGERVDDVPCTATARVRELSRGGRRKNDVIDAAAAASVAALAGEATPVGVDERRKAAGPGGHSGATLTSSAAGTTPTASSSGKSLPGPASNDPTTSDPAA